jgi:hypothetical protein
MASCDGPSMRGVPWYLHPYFAAALSGAGTIASALVLKRLHPEGALRVAAALLAVPPSAFMMYCFVRWIRGLDELHHRMVFEAVSIAFLLSLLAVMVLEGLQRAGYDPGVRWEHAWVGMLVLYAAAYAYARRRYR